jgi:phospholipid/cholesterol/gamma-HCH transport system permease protein
MTNFLTILGEWAVFAGRGTVATLRTVTQPGLWLKPFYNVLIGGMPLAMVAGLALGAVIWMHTRGVLARTGGGAVEYLPTFLAAAVLLELAPIAAGLIVATRTGASLGAEIASMQASEQVDALEMLGISPMVRLIGPRVLACLFATPLLHVIIATLAISSGFLAELVSGSTTVLKYQSAVMRELRLAEIVPAAMKTFAFGWLIGITGCFLGLRARGGSEGVGHAATQCVVWCTLLVLAADVFLVGLIQVVFG